jgi:hypothetical protein
MGPRSRTGGWFRWDWGRSAGARLPQLGEGRVEIGHPDCEVLAQAPGWLCLQKVELFAACVEPRPAKLQVRAIRPALEPEIAFVECQRLIDIANVESDVVDAEGLHCSNVTDGERSRCKSPVVRARL